MKMCNQIVVNAPAQQVFERAAATEEWPEILPHYRFVRVLSSNGNARVVEMAARRGAIPVRWRAEQVNDPQTPRIYFRHLAGWTRGMQVVWRFEADAAGTRVCIDHELRSPLASFIGKYFIDPIATRTLACMKEIIESAAPSGSNRA
jgi:ribosome-associated toxin RatA of RatAB toxin-antitoxin module